MIKKKKTNPNFHQNLGNCLGSQYSEPLFPVTISLTVQHCQGTSQKNIYGHMCYLFLESIQNLNRNYRLTHLKYFYLSKTQYLIKILQ